MNIPAIEAEETLEDIVELIEAVPGYKQGGALSRLCEALMDVVTSCPEETVIATRDAIASGILHP